MDPQVNICFYNFSKSLEKTNAQLNGDINDTYLSFYGNIHDNIW